MFMTAAGSIPPAKVFIIGAGVAGLQAIATCRRLGAVVEAFDVRPAVKEEVESLGGKLVQVAEIMEEQSDSSGYAKELSEEKHKKELELIAARLQKCDVCITTALIPGRAAPKLITNEMIPAMKHGSVIVDLAAINGGNCEATVPGQIVSVNGVTIIGKTDFLSEVALDASRMYSKNITEFLNVFAPEGKANLDLEDQILNDMLVTHDGVIRHEPTRQKMEQGG
jgi:NAD(P) transhydrogenase subunit alpha